MDLTRGDDGADLHASKPKALDTEYPKLDLGGGRPMRAIYNGLVRFTITDGFKLDENHVRDFYHTAVSLHCADMVPLDSHWLRQARKLKIPERLVRTYGKDEIETFLCDFETMYEAVR